MGRGALKLFAEYGDGVVHETRWSTAHERSVACCGAHFGIPLRCYLEHQVPADSDQCGYCLNGLDSPRAGQPNQARVPNDRLIAAVMESGIRIDKLAARAGYRKPKRDGTRIVGTLPDGDRVRYMLGMIPRTYSPRTGAPTYVRTIPREDAIRLADALGLDAEEAGL